jgi:hypothetical protein
MFSKRARSESRSRAIAGCVAMMLIMGACNSAATAPATPEPTWTAAQADACSTEYGRLASLIGDPDKPTYLHGAIGSFGWDVSDRASYDAPIAATIDLLTQSKGTASGQLMEPELDLIVDGLAKVRTRMQSPMTEDEFRAVVDELIDIDYAIDGGGGTVDGRKISLSDNCHRIHDWVDHNVAQ